MVVEGGGKKALNRSSISELAIAYMNVYIYIQNVVQRNIKNHIRKGKEKIQMDKPKFRE